MKWTDTLKTMALFTLLFALLVFLTVGQVHAQEPFTDVLNSARAQRGLGSVQHNDALLPIAQQNNAIQRVYGLGHWYTGGLAQVAAMGTGDISVVLGMFAASGAHAALIFAPNLTSVAYANDGYYATAALVMGQPQQTTQPRGPSPMSRDVDHARANLSGCVGPSCQGERKYVQAAARTAYFPRQRGFHPFKRLFYCR